MYLKDGQWVFAPTDLTAYLDSPFASWMEQLALCRPDAVPAKDADDAMSDLLKAKGDAHERGLRDAFMAQGLSLIDISLTPEPEQATREAMVQGVEVIYQAVLCKPPFKGYADFLLKVAGASELGDYHYQVWDTKLSKVVKSSYAVQLCAYQDMLAAVQGRISEFSVIALGSGENERLRTLDFWYYYQSVKQRFLQSCRDFNPDNRPSPADSKTWGRWEGFAKQCLLEVDHLSRVARITRGQIKKLEAAGIATMSDLASGRLSHIPGLSQAVYQRLQAQADLQKQSDGCERPAYRVIVPAAGEKQGLALLPPASPLDVFFDIEGYPLIDGGLEYLWGNTYFDEQGERRFKDFWAHNAEQEKSAFKAFIGWVFERWQRDPSMHIYHYANYEIAACRKLMSRYGVCEYEVDQLLRNQVFVDLYTVVKGGLLIGEPKYSIKNVEHLYRGRRETDVGTGGDSVVVYEHWRDHPDGDSWQSSPTLQSIRDYNIDDCDSTQELVDWLRGEQQQHQIAFLGKTEVEEPETPQEVGERLKLRDCLLKRAQVEQDADPQAAALTENLAWMLEFHRREAKPMFWRLFDRLGLSEQELEDDLDCLAGCVRTEREPFKLTSRKKKHAYEYRYQVNQPCKLSAKSYYVLGGEDAKGKPLKLDYVADASDLAEGLIVLEAMEPPPAVITLVPDEYVRPDPVPQGIESVVRGYWQQGATDCAIMDFLLRRTPRIKGLPEGEPIAPDPDPQQRLQHIIEAVTHLQHSYLPIQGPPGAGKTYTGKHVIAELLRRGKRVGISSNSHKAINNLLLGTAQYCQQQRIAADFYCTKDTDPALVEAGVSIVKNSDLEGAATASKACVLGTTAWGFSRDDMNNRLDYLFVDEAGQVAVANLVAMSQSADNLVLMGDQMQLGQPAQGTHPAESGLSTLDYLLHHEATISDDKGVFLGTTFRMHSAVNQFISDAVYEGKLTSHPDNDMQTIAVPDDYSGPLNKQAGIVYLPVEHEGNTQASDEEVALIKDAAQQMLGRIFTDKSGTQRAIGWDDMLFVAPYNFQVNKLMQALGPQAKVGSVDKFQGQEAPVVLLSMCASDAAESPRGMEFLFDRNRLNVAVSRAQSLAMVVASPNLVASRANNLAQQRQLNLYCQLIDSASRGVGAR